MPTAKVTPAKLHESYEYCRSVAKKYAKTFYFATGFLAPEKRPPVYAIYALCRYVDDLVDRAEDKISHQSLTKDKVTALIEQSKLDLEACYNGELIDNPIMLAWLDTLQNYHIPMHLPFELIEGVCMDLEFKSFETFDELYVYCYKVASIVGLMTSEIFGYSDKVALEYAIKLGIAMQLTNILRDIGEDAGTGRLYLPLEDLRRFGYSENDLKQKVINEQFIALMKFEIERARHYYDEADKGIPMLTRDSRMAVKLSRVNYSRILDYIERNNYDVFSKRAYVPLPQKLLSLPATWFELKRLK
ncbi:MAG: squalene/phytoene synthase family protein [Chlorobiales bacterium]|nr:squalene/phytoene synthase family protein [Chlorobiales bacterium]